MALTCPVCSAENREGANFCMRCGERLTPASAPPIPAAPTPNPSTRFEREWAATAPAQLRAPTIPGELHDAAALGPRSKEQPGDGDAERTVLLGAGKPTRAPKPESSSDESAEARRARRRERAQAQAAQPAVGRRGMWLWVGLLVLGVAMIAAGWYGFGSRGAAPAAPTPAVVAPAPQ
ncbi:zinc ribbon domain-containing protein, partial [Variovorax paradoxus]